MSLARLGETRSRRALDHMLQTPESFVWAPLPGMKNGTAVVHASPAIGAGFAQYTALLEAGGELADTQHSRFLYILEGTLTLHRAAISETLTAGSFCYIASAEEHTVHAEGGRARVVVIEKPYVALASGGCPPALSGKEADVPGVPLLGDEGVQVRSLLPPDPLFDFAVNTMEYRPGARLGMVESHVMEHGLLMLEGEGIYRLGDAWYPVTAGDFIWMAPFCPQWFGALGDAPARYLIYKDWNRPPLTLWERK